ncbi:MAG: hypothetical protein JXN59_02420, partial [Anaerolineae bacterium]|nr:hypothetical protein [Anaerolineae bacterium]
MPRSHLLRHVILALCLLIGVLPAGAVVQAQGDDQPLQFNTPVTVSLVTGQAAVRTFSVSQGDSVEIRLSRLGDYLCTVVLIDPSQQITLLEPDADGVYTHQLIEALESGVYALVIQATSGAGDMTIQVNHLGASASSLIVGDTLIDVQTQEVQYNLVPPPGVTAPMRLSLRAAGGIEGVSFLLPAITLMRADTGAAALSVGAGILPGLVVTLPAQVPFVLAIQSGQPGQQVQVGWVADE